MNYPEQTSSWTRWAAAWLVFASLFAAVRLHAGAPRFSDPAQDINRVIELLDRRLDLMPEIAAWKRQHEQPVTDLERERLVLQQSVAEAGGIHLEPEAARAFFLVQILMARAVQENLLGRWQSGGPPPPVARDLAKELRPQLDTIGRELLSAVYLATTALAEAGEPELLRRVARLRRHPGITADHITQLAPALAAMRITAAPTLAVLRRVGYVRVGTTGDYAPFSSDAGGELHGLDVGLAEALAKEWGVTPVFVRTTWPTLMADLQQRRFDLAASGITVTPERSRLADFSVPYHADGKTPIARRAEVARFSSLEKIDQPGVRVVVNPGGTNERFVREHVTRAAIVVHSDNRTIFNEIIAGRADVMITDAIEVKLQERRHPELVATMATPLTQAGKAILLPSGSELTAPINAWLAPRVQQGQIAEQMEKALAEAK